MTTIQVGPSREVKTPYDAALLIAEKKIPAPRVEIDAAIYEGQAGLFGSTADSTSLIGFSGPGMARPQLIAATLPGTLLPITFPRYIDGPEHRPFNGMQGKGQVVLIGNDAIAENIEISGAKNGDGNGAGIRAQGLRVTVRNCFFHGNENGFLSSEQLLDGALAGWVILEDNESFENGCRNPLSPNFGKSHNFYVGPSRRCLAIRNISRRALGQGLLLKIHSGGGDQFVFGNILKDTDEDNQTSYQLDLSNGLAVVCANDLYKGLNGPSKSKVIYYDTGRDMTPLTGNQVFIYGNRIECHLQARGAMIRVLGTDSQLDPDTNVELVTGRIWQNTMIYTKSPAGMDFGYQPIVAPQTVAVLDNLLLQEIPKIETNGLIWDGLDAYAAMLRAMTV